MPKKILLDTNAFFLLLQPDSVDAVVNLKNEIKNYNSVYIPEIALMELYSVLGKYRRFSPAGACRCNRTIIDQNGTHSTCCNSWKPALPKRINKQQYKNMLKLAHQIENGTSTIKVQILKINSSAVDAGKQYLKLYSEKYQFGSHDAIIAGFLCAAEKELLSKFRLATSDKGFKSLLNAAQIPSYDPRTNIRS